MARLTPNRGTRAELRYQQGTSDKVYQVELRQVSTTPSLWTVEVWYGRRGSNLTKHVKMLPGPWLRAQQAFSDTVAEKLNKGYEEFAWEDLGPEEVPAPTHWPMPSYSAPEGT